jgi:hypothetical protein
VPWHHQKDLLRHCQHILCLSAVPSSSPLPINGTNCKNHWSWRLTSPSLTLSISCQSCLPITVPVHSPSVNSTPSYLIPILVFSFFLFCTPVSLLAHHHLHIYHSSVNANCNYLASMVYLLPYLPNLLHLHTLYVDFSIVLLTVHLFICNSVLLFMSHCFALSWPGRSCKWQLVLN